MNSFIEKAFSSVSRETLERLTIYETLIRKWNPVINLVSANTVPSMIDRHFLDSAQVFSLAGPSWDHWTDLGSGGGFPGMIVAILALEENPSGVISLVESDQRKAAFLRTVARETGVRADVHAVRIEQLKTPGSDVISARALAPLTGLLELACPHLAENGVALFHKGAGWKNELEEARAQWHFDVRSHRSVTNPEAVVLEVKELSHV